MSKSRDSRKAKAIELVQQHVPAGGSVLEVSCGQGGELSRLKTLGYKVRGTNFSKYEDVLGDIEVDDGVDIMKHLPYEDNSFDCVLVLEVASHLSDHDHPVSELGRVCAEGGHVIVMTPNIMRLTSRLHFFLTGFLKVKRAFIGFDVPHQSAFAFHNYPPHLPVFLYQLYSHDLQCVDFTASVYKMKSFILYVMFLPVIWLATGWKVNFEEKNLKGTAAAKKLHQVLTSVAGLCGEYWFVVAQKRIESRDTNTTLPKWSETWETK